MLLSPFSSIFLHWGSISNTSYSLVETVHTVGRILRGFLPEKNSRVVARGPFPWQL